MPKDFTIITNNGIVIDMDCTTYSYRLTQFYHFYYNMSIKIL